MNSALAAEIGKLEKLLGQLGIPYEPQEGANPAELLEVENALGVRFDDNLRAMYEFSNGSARKDWFVVQSDQLVTCHFFAVQTGRELVESFLAMDERGELIRELDDHRDERIQPQIWFHPNWFLFAESGGGSYVYYDGFPTVKGQYGQIVMYQHDPDVVNYVAGDFLEFFRKSNNNLEKYVNGEIADELYFNEPF